MLTVTSKPTPRPATRRVKPNRDRFRQPRGRRRIQGRFRRCLDEQTTGPRQSTAGTPRGRCRGRAPNRPRGSAIRTRPRSTRTAQPAQPAQSADPPAPGRGTRPRLPPLVRLAIVFQFEQPRSTRKPPSIARSVNFSAHAPTTHASPSRSNSSPRSANNSSTSSPSGGEPGFAPSNQQARRARGALWTIVNVFDMDVGQHRDPRCGRHEPGVSR